MSEFSLAMLGGDSRQTWMATVLQRHHALSAVYQVPDYQGSVPILSDVTQLCHYTCIAGPVPLARNSLVVLPDGATAAAFIAASTNFTAGTNFSRWKSTRCFCRAMSETANCHL